MKLRIAAIGIEERQAHILAQMLTVYARHLDKEWDFVGNFDSETVIASMGSVITANIRLIDVDSELGKRVWYILQAIENEKELVAFTENSKVSGYSLFIQKPISAHFESLISILNTF
jgi:hypothetical protein